MSQAVFQVTGEAIPALSGIDELVRSFLEGNAIKAAQIAIARGGAPVFSRAYTLAQPPFQLAQPGSLFRIAGLSQIYTCAAIHTLCAEGRLAPDLAVFSRLGIDSPALPSQMDTYDPRVDGITVQQLLDHAGGWDKDESAFDPLFQTREIARRLKLGAPTQKRDVARFMYGEELQFAPGQPGSRTPHSNFGYLLLGLLVEEVTGMPFMDYVRYAVLSPIRVKDVYLARTLAGAIHGREVAPDAPDLGPSALEPDAEVHAPLCASGDGFITEVGDSCGGLMATAESVVKTIRHHAVLGVGPRAPGTSRAGLGAGVSAWAESRGDDIDWAICLNKRLPWNVATTAPSITKKLNQLINAGT